jgi:hypothetical protein
MALRLPAFVPKALLIAVVALLATAGLTYAAEQTLAPSNAPAASAPAPVQKRAVLVVPDLRRQAFVFAKGALQDAGFAWHVVGGVHGYAANVVVGQTPEPGTRLFDTGAPAVKLTLSHNGKYPQSGSPEDVSPYRATAVELAGAAAAPLAPAPATTTPTPATTTPAPAATGTTTAATAPETAVKPTAKPAAKPAAAPKVRYPQIRPVAFTAAGAPKEPLDEMPLTDRSALLGRWLDAHPKPTNAGVSHWLYQNEWIVTGAKFGWWRGAAALQKLIAVDRRAEALWGIGTKSEAAAASALAEVEARSK